MGDTKDVRWHTLEVVLGFVGAEAWWSLTPFVCRESTGAMIPAVCCIAVWSKINVIFFVLLFTQTGGTSGEKTEFCLPF